MQLNPARGRKLVRVASDADTCEAGFMQLNPARGRKLAIFDCHSLLVRLRFMQLNPARGRKRVENKLSLVDNKQGLCSSTPRGDGNLSRDEGAMSPDSTRFMQLNPARGRKRFLSSKLTNTCDGVYAAQPREGTETDFVLIAYAANTFVGLCSSTPRGDGNSNHPPNESAESNALVYAAQPREGTETEDLYKGSEAYEGHGLCSSTPRGDGNSTNLAGAVIITSSWFMQLNPARGRKHVHKGIEDSQRTRGLCSSTPRGDGN